MINDIPRHATSSRTDTASPERLSHTRASAPPAPDAHPKGPRFAQLDAIRGLAALSVVFFHYSLLFEAGTPFAPLHDTLDALKWTPVVAVFAGHQPVLVFFILSGFVLTLMLGRVPALPYGTYMWRRFTRLYIPYAAVMILVFLASAALTGDTIPELGRWFNTHWTLPVTAPRVLGPALFIGAFDTEPYNYVIWTLVYEMRLSIVFPALLAGVLYFGWKVSLSVAALGSLVAAVVFNQTITTHPAAANYILTVHYALLFVLGALIALHADWVSAMYRHLTRSQKVLLIVLGAASYCYGAAPERLLGISNTVLLDWLTLPGVLVVVLFALQSPRARPLLMRPFPQFLGRISYSLYLIHPLVQLGVVHTLHQYRHLPLPVVLAVALVATLPVAALSYRFIELPAIKLGQRLSGPDRCRVARTTLP